MKRGTLTLALAGAALALAFPIASALSEPPTDGDSFLLAQADGPGAPPPGMMMHHGRGEDGGPGGAFHHRCENADAHRAALLAFAEVKLQITDAEKPAWTKFADAVKTAGQSQAKLCADLADKHPATLPERVARAEQVASARVAEIQAVSPALNELYTQLTPEQRKVADALAGHFGPRHHHHDD